MDAQKDKCKRDILFTSCVWQIFSGAESSGAAERRVSIVTILCAVVVKSSELLVMERISLFIRLGKCNIRIYSFRTVQSSMKELTSWFHTRYSSFKKKGLARHCGLAPALPAPRVAFPTAYFFLSSWLALHSIPLGALDVPESWFLQTRPSSLQKTN